MKMPWRFASIALALAAALPTEAAADERWMAGVGAALATHRAVGAGDRVGGRVPAHAGPAFPSQLELVDLDEELGVTWGAGFGWRSRSGLSVEMSYRRHRLEVMNIEAVGIDLSLTR